MSNKKHKKWSKWLYQSSCQFFCCVVLTKSCYFSSFLAKVWGQKIYSWPNGPMFSAHPLKSYGMTLESLWKLRPFPRDPAIKHCQKEITRNQQSWRRHSKYSAMIDRQQSRSGESIFIDSWCLGRDIDKSLLQARFNYSDSCLRKDGANVKHFSTLFCLQKLCQYWIHLYL